MAERRSSYLFYDEQDYNNLRDAVYEGNSTLYYDPNKVYWYGYSGYHDGHDRSWRVDLMDRLTQDELEWIVSHIREHNGHYKSEHKQTCHLNVKATYKTTWQCHKCMTCVTTLQEDAGFVNGYERSQLQDGPCAAGGDHDWHELTVGVWID